MAPDIGVGLVTTVVGLVEQAVRVVHIPNGQVGGLAVDHGLAGLAVALVRA